MFEIYRHVCRQSTVQRWLLIQNVVSVQSVFFPMWDGSVVADFPGNVQHFFVLGLFASCSAFLEVLLFHTKQPKDRELK